MSLQRTLALCRLSFQSGLDGISTTYSYGLGLLRCAISSEFAAVLHSLLHLCSGPQCCSAAVGVSRLQAALLGNTAVSRREVVVHCVLSRYSAAAVKRVACGLHAAAFGLIAGRTPPRSLSLFTACSAVRDICVAVCAAAQQLPSTLAALGQHAPCL